MVDKTYQPKVYRKQGGDEQVVASGGKITVESGGNIEGEATGAFTFPAGEIETNDIADEAVTAAKMANGAGVAAMLATGLGNSDAYPKETVGVQTLLDQTAEPAKAVLIVIVVTEVFADGTGAQPVFTVGEVDGATKFDDGSLLVDAAEGAIFVLAGSLTAAKDLIVTATAATGNGTGAISVTALALPASS